MHVELDRPEVRNAFNDELIEALRDCFSGLDGKVRAVVLSGAGKSFCAGGDLQWMRKAATYTAEENERDALALADLFRLISSSRAYVIAKVHGAAFGGGCGLVAAADAAYTHADTKFAFSEVRLGLIPATISTVVVPKIGAGNARALFASGETFDAERALRIGLVHRIGSESEVEEAVSASLDAVLAAGPEAVHASKLLAQEPLLKLDEAARRLAETRAGSEAKEGVAAFLEKREASYVERH